MRRARTLLALGLASLAAAAAHADGAFPDSMSVQFPAGGAHRVALATNFGLLLSDDGGQTFRYVCEPYLRNDATDNVSLYPLAPDGSFLAIYYSGMTRSSPDECTWTAATNLAAVRDAFVDPNDASTVFAIVTSASGDSLVVSHDGGRTFPSTVYGTANQLFGVEVAKAQSGVVYAAEFARSGDAGVASRAWLLRSADGGAHWTPYVIPASGPGASLLLAVDPNDANTVYVRAVGTPGDALLITSDGGQSFTAALQLSTPFSSFVRASDGTLYVGTATGELWSRALLANAFSKRDGPLLRCLGEKDGRLYACGDPVKDGFNLGKSDDGGKTWQPLFDFQNLLGPLTCSAVQNGCAADWVYLQKVLAVTPQPGASSGGCHCGAAGDAGLLALLIVFVFNRRRRR